MVPVGNVMIDPKATNFITGESGFRREFGYYSPVPSYVEPHEANGSQDTIQSLQYIGPL